MSNLTRDFFIALSNNKLLNKGAQKWGFRLGAEQFVAGLDVDSVLQSVKKLNEKGISATVDHLGEFVTDRSVSLRAKQNILHLIERIHEEKVDCHVSVKLTQLGLDIDEQFCLDNMFEIVELANKYDIFINIDTEDYLHYEQTLRVLDALREKYDNVGTVIQSYLFRAEEDMDRLKDARLRIVKGAYKESESVAYQSKEEIDANFLKLAKKRLKGDAFTSIATHDHNIINELKRFVEEENIDKNNFEFQMLYGFRTDMQEALAKEGYLFCTYVPFGEDWYGYFMRRLAERPQNINLIIKDKLYDSDNRIKKTPVIVGSAVVASLAYFLCRRKK
ncbi:MAG TPA: proline dehydrogenase family protein [Pseudogracilibacillus sp.]|nr:proline dehydrogenase family protein [Pseudogracilibacillus sp.]HZW68562.1 proline dehydrogenase family protein [Pseudogracilibacillus sp.]